MLDSGALKRLMAAAAVVLLCAAIVLIAVGSVVHERFLPFAAFYAGRLGPAIILIVTGVLSFPLVALLAFAVLRERIWALYLFLAVLACLIACEIGAAIAAFEYRFVIGPAVRDRVRYELDECRGAGLDIVQERLRCCGGIRGPEDYRVRGLPLPSSCCPGGCGRGAPYWVPCESRLEDHFRHYVLHVGITAIVLLCIQFLGFLVGCWLASAYRAENALIYTVNQ